MRPRRAPLRVLRMRLRRRRRVLLSASSPMNFVVMAPVLRVLAADPDVRLVFTSHAPGPERMPERAGLPPIPFVDPEAAKRTAFDLYFCVDGTRFGKRCTRRVATFHGVSLKGRSLGARLRWFHRVLLVGPYQRRRLVERGIFAPDDPALVPTGMPKLDRLARGEIDVEPLRRRAGIAPGRRVVLYAPTWGEHGALARYGRDLVDALAERRDVHVLLKLHDHARDPARSGRDWFAEARSWSGPRVTLVEDADVVPWLAAADVLVTDASSVAQEYLLLDRPILFAETPELLAEERYRDTFDREAWERRPGERFADPREARRALDRALSDPARFSSERRALAREMFHEPGGATARVVSALYRELAKRPPEAALSAGLPTEEDG